MENYKDKKNLSRVDRCEVIATRDNYFTSHSFRVDGLYTFWVVYFRGDLQITRPSGGRTLSVCHKISVEDPE